MAAETAPQVGPQRLLAWTYAVFVVAAGARSAVQLATGAPEAVPAHVLSAVAAVAYAVGLALVVSTRRGMPRRVTAAWCVVELVGVLTVGAISWLRPSAFADDTVWSHFGAGYLFLPLALPCAVLVWLRAGALPPAITRG